MNNDNHLQQLVARIRRRAAKTRRFAKLSIGGIVAVVALMILFFYIGSLSGGLRVFSFGRIEFARPSEELTSEKPTVVAAIRELEDQIETMRSEIRSQSDFQADVLLSVASTIVRIASVFLAVYLIQILVGFTRYQFRIADHLDATGDTLEITSGDPDTLSKVASVLAPQHIEFGKMPKTPTEQSIELIRDLVSKLPSK